MHLLGNNPPSLGGTNRSSGCTFWEIILLREEAQLEVPLLSLKCHQDDYHHCSFLHVYIYFEHMGQNEYNLNRMAIATKYSFWLYVNYRSYQKNPKTRKIFHYETHNNMQCLRDKLKVVGCPAFFYLSFRRGKVQSMLIRSITVLILRATNGFLNIRVVLMWFI
jgi:hypothetical protein